MATGPDDPKNPAEPSRPRATSLKFNAVGRDDPAAVVLTPRTDPAVRRRAVYIVVLAIVAIAILVLVTLNPFGYQKTGGSGGGENRAFGPGERPQDPGRP